MSKTKTQARKRSLSSLISRLVPDRLEEAYDSVEDYLGAYAHLPGERASRLVEAAGELIDHCGESVQGVLYELLCDKKSTLRKTTEGTLSSGVKATVGVLVPVLVAQFALAPAVALVVATLVVRVIATKGEQALCEELAKRARAQAKVGGKTTGRPTSARRPPSKRKCPAGRSGAKKPSTPTRRRRTERKSG